MIPFGKPTVGHSNAAKPSAASDEIARQIGFMAQLQSIFVTRAEFAWVRLIAWIAAGACVSVVLRRIASGGVF